jgi:Protein of unknown function (DUF4058)
VPVHDWTLVEAGIFHSFHTTWIAEINTALNDGLLPKGYYSLAEQHAGEAIADVLTLYESRPEPEPLPPPPATGGTILADAPPRVQRKQTLQRDSMLERRRSIAVRHVSNHRLVALLEIVSPANKDRAAHVADFVSKAVDALEIGVHLLLVDLFPPGKHDRSGLHGAIQERLTHRDEPYDLPRDTPLTVASYVSQREVDVYLEHLAVGATLPEMPLFLRPDRYVSVPLESTCSAAFKGMPSIWRDVLEQGKGA